MAPGARASSHPPGRASRLCPLPEERRYGNRPLPLKWRGFLLPGFRPETSLKHVASGTEQFGRGYNRLQGGTCSQGSPTAQEHNGFLELVQLEQRRLKPGTFPPLPLKGRGIHGLKPHYGDQEIRWALLGRVRCRWRAGVCLSLQEGCPGSGQASGSSVTLSPRSFPGPGGCWAAWWA